MNKDEQIEMLISNRDKHREAYKAMHILCLEAGKLLRKIVDGFEGQDEALTEGYADKVAAMYDRLYFERPEDRG